MQSPFTAADRTPLNRAASAQNFLTAHGIDFDPRRPTAHRHAEFIKAILAVQNIPLGTADSASGVVREGRGTPRGKHLLLAETLRAMKLPYRHVLSTFYWPEQQLRLPAALQAAALQSLWPQLHHTLEVQTVLGNTVHVDVSWPASLARFGFNSIDPEWDGFQSFYAMRKRSVAWVGNSGWSQAADQLIEEMPERSRIASLIFDRLLLDWLQTLDSDSPAAKANLM